MIQLAESPLFAGLAPVELARLVAELQERHLAAGEVVFRRGDPGDCLYVVRAGVAEARAGELDDGSYPVAVYQPGDSFGESALLTDEPRSSTVVALTELDLWALPKERFRALLAATPSLALTVGRIISRRLQTAHQAVSAMHRAFDSAAEQAYLALDPELQRFLRRTAPLNPVLAEVAARALGRRDATQILAYLAARLPFVTTAEPGVYHYHPLFRELLDAKLAEELGESGRSAWLENLARCAEELGHPLLAVRLLIQGDQADAAQKLAVSHGRALYDLGRLEEAAPFLNGLPESVKRSPGRLADLRADVLAAQGRLREAVDVLVEASTGEAPLKHLDEAARVHRYRRLAELNYSLGRAGEAHHWAARAGDKPRPIARQTLEELEPPPALSPNGLGGRRRALITLPALRRVSASLGALGGQGLSVPLGLLLAGSVLLWFMLSPAPGGLTREAYLALGILIAALPLLVFSVLPEHLVTLLMVVGWAGLGLVPARVALSGFATPGWFLVLSVLAVGVALARSGLLYRLVLGLLARVPANHLLLTTAVAGAGILFTPVMPNATARTALAAPLALEITETIGYRHRSRGSASIGMAMLLGFGQMCALFLTGSSSGLLVHSLLPEESRLRFGWVEWFVAALPLHIVIFVISYLGVLLFLRPEHTASRASGTVQTQRRILGGLTTAERIGVGVFVFLLLAFSVGPAFRIDPAWPAVLAMVLLGATGVLDQHSFRNGINWSFLIFFGVMISLGDVFSTLGVDTWLANIAAAPLAPLASNPAVFLLAVALAGYLLNLVVRWQAACVLLTLVLVPVAAPLGVEPWVIGITAVVTTNMWFLPYQSTIYQALYYGSNEQVFSHAQARPIALVYGVACLLGLVVSVPYWQAMGLLPR